MTIQFMNHWKWKPSQRVWGLAYCNAGVNSFRTAWVLIGAFGFFLYIAHPFGK